MIKDKSIKKQLSAAFTISLFLISVVFINVGNASSQTSQTVQSIGSIQGADSEVTLTENYAESTKVIVRHIGNPMPDWTANINANVDMWVAAHSWIEGGAVIVDMEDIAPILWFNQAGYNGYVFTPTSGTWSSTGWTFAQIQQLIDRFHYNNVSVILGMIGFAKTPSTSCWTSNIWGWIYNTHPELFFTKYNSGGTSYFGVRNGEYSYPAPINFFATFASDDPTSGAVRGQKLVSLLNMRLTEMINAGLQWDGFFGSEGWGSVGHWGLTIDASTQLTSEYGQWTTLSLPQNWATMTGAERFSWIQQSSTYQKNFENWAGYMYAANLFKPVHDTLRSLRESSGFFVGMLFSPDQTWQDKSRAAEWGGWSQDVGYDAAYLAQYCSEPTYIYWVNQEGTDWSPTMAQQQAYSAAIIKSSNVRFNVVIGLHTLNNNGPSAPLSWLYKEYLAQACDYLWVNGQRYPAVNPNIIVIQYPDNTSKAGYFNSGLNELFNWVNNVKTTLATSSPVYLGPTYVVTSTQRTYADQAWSTLNYTFLQWTTTNDLSNKPQNLNWGMNTLYLPEIEIRERGDLLYNLQDSILNAFANGSLSIIVSSESVYSDQGILQTGLFSGTSTTNPLATFHINGPSTWTASNSTKIQTQTDTYAKWIIGNYAGNTYTPKNNWYSASQAYALRGYYSESGFMEIGKLTSGLIQYGIYCNSSSGNFLYGQFQRILPADMLNRGIQWASKTPITSSNSLIENAVYNTLTGLAIPMWNMQNENTLAFTLNIDSSRLGLAPINNYAFSWASNPLVTWTESSWTNLSTLTLTNGADILIINHK